MFAKTSFFYSDIRKVEFVLLIPFISTEWSFLHAQVTFIIIFL